MLGAVGKAHEAYRTVTDVGAKGAEKITDVGKKGVSETKKGFKKVTGLFKKKKKKPKPKPKPKKTTIKRVEKLEIGSHEGDWEHIDVFIKEKKPTSSDYTIKKVFYARHKNEDGRFDRFEAVESTHPIVYSAQFGHASYGVPVFGVNKLADKANGQGARWQTWKNIIYLGTKDEPAVGSEWLRYKGKWGEITSPPRAGWWLK